MMNPKYLLIFLMMFLLQFCNKGAQCEIEEKSNDEELAKVKLDFSPSPIDLGGIDADFCKDISYGPYKENKFDIFIPKADNPTPLVIYIHGGYFVTGDKTDPYINTWDYEWNTPDAIIKLLESKIAFASINYRLLLENGDKEGVLKPMSDSKRCLQYIRNISSVLNIDKKNILLSGRSAGAGTSLWLAFSDDMADLTNVDPVLRESTRVKGAVVRATQSTYDLQRFETDVFDEFNFRWIDYLLIDNSLLPLFKSFYSIDNIYDLVSERVTQYREKVDMLGLMSPDDPEFFASNPLVSINVVPTNKDVLTHHALHVRTLKHWADSIGIPSVVYYDTYNDPSGENVIEFMFRKLWED